MNAKAVSQVELARLMNRARYATGRPVIGSWHETGDKGLGSSSTCAGSEQHICLRPHCKIKKCHSISAQDHLLNCFQLAPELSWKFNWNLCHMQKSMTQIKWHGFQRFGLFTTAPVSGGTFCRFESRSSRQSWLSMTFATWLNFMAWLFSSWKVKNEPSENNSKTERETRGQFYQNDTLTPHEPTM